VNVGRADSRVPRHTVAEAAARAGVAPHVVRYYARIGLLRPGRNPANGYRLFSDRDVARLRFVRKAQALGFSLAEIRQILADADKGRSPCPRVRAILGRRVDENRRRLEELQALQRRMERALAEWERMPDALPTGDSVCHLIESADTPQG